MADTTTCTCPINTFRLSPDPMHPGYAVLDVACIDAHCDIPTWSVSYHGLTAPEALDVISVYAGSNEHRHDDVDRVVSLSPA